MTKTVAEELQELKDWVQALDKREAGGFAHLVKLPNAIEAISCLPECPYKSMALKALAVKRYFDSTRQLPKEDKE